MDNSDSTFEDDNVWFFDDLTGSDREWAEDMGCEPGKAYFGDANVDNEVPVCPFCHVAVWHPLKTWSESSCKHLVFAYDMNEGFVYVHTGFANIFWGNIFPQNEDFYDGEEISTMQRKGTLPFPDDLLDYIPSLKLYSISSTFGITGVDCGFVSDKFMSEYSITPERKAKQSR